MTHIDRRTLLYAFGIGSATLMLPRMATASGKVAVAKAGENRFSFATDAQARATPCKVSSEDSGGACTVLELKALPRSGPFLHVHHREDEWYYVLSGEFVFRAGGEDSIFQRAVAFGYLAASRMCGRTQRQPRASSS
jgi:hypothetical protein